MRENLPTSLRLMFGHEGGYVNARTDAGGPTKYGITHKTLAAHRGVPSVTAAQVKAMGMPEAEAIYRETYWTQSGGDTLPAGLDYAAFDFGVNSGPPRAVKTLQKVLGCPQDGWIGPQTLRLIEDYPGGVSALIADYCDARMAFLRSLKNAKTGFPVNGRGWTIRVLGTDPKGQWAPQLGVLGNAMAMANKEQATRPQTATMPPMVAEEAQAKAEPAEPNPWTKPETVLTVGGGVATAGSTVMASGMDPVRIAIAVAILVIAGLAAFYIYKRIKATPA